MKCITLRLLLSLPAIALVTGCTAAGAQAPAPASVLGGSCRVEQAGPGEEIVTQGNERLKIVNGDLYACRKDKWVFGGSLLANFGKNYKIEKTGNKCEITVLRTGARQQLDRYFSSGFEVAELRDLFESEGWQSMSLLSPKANTVKKYVELHRQIMNGSDFLDNRIDLDSEKARAGNKALRFYAVAPDPPRNKTSKSLIEKKSLCFGKGDHIWFSAWYYLERGLPASLVDFETGHFIGGPGMRLMIRRGGYATMELKSFEKKQYEQFKRPIPRQRWFNIKVHLKLSNRDDGIIEIWQDGRKILSASGKTLPTHDTIYNMLQVGITAASHETTLLVDDVTISDQRF